MNLFSEFVKRSFEYFGLNKFYLRGPENTQKTTFNEISGFHIVDGFNIFECESFLFISDDKTHSDENIYLTCSERMEVETTGINKVTCTDEYHICKNNKNTVELNELNFNDKFKNSTARTVAAKLDSIKYENSAEALITNKYDQTKIKSIFSFSNSKNPDYFCTTPQVKCNNHFQTNKNEKLCFTPENYKIENEIILGKDFSKSEILILLRIERKKLALLENQLRKDIDTLEKSKYDKTNKLINDDVINSNLISCPAQLYFIKHRINNTKEIIENMEKDIAILEQKISETY
ncbi:hypothetical protein FG386_002653 [Cryptosporidium ryanae]|uniref:uncharacterized protein n=1 Tax=Cryptosporidium ryanae TaxID=515981 RepID=UPI00351A07D9|nr:hypothetical protein FG386_002653 [Cryptosporidium ryanae]